MTQGLFCVEREAMSESISVSINRSIIRSSMHTQQYKTTVVYNEHTEAKRGKQ